MSGSGLLPVIYSLDTTGVDINNKITDEVHQLQSKKVRAISPRYSPFFSESISMKDTLTGLPISSESYKFFNLQGLASAMYGKEIYNIILITDENISNNVEVTYQTLGGEYTRLYDSGIDLINMLYDDNRPVDWPNIIDKPEEFKPNLHLHAIGDTIGFEYLVASIERLRTTIMVASCLRADDIMTYLENRLGSLSTINSQLEMSIEAATGNIANFTAHVNDINNPHETTKAQVGLDMVSNYTTINSINELSSPNENSPKYVLNTILKDYLNNIFNTFSIDIQNKFSDTYALANTVTGKLQTIESILSNLPANIVTFNTLNSKQDALAIRMTAVENNMTSSTSNAQALINQYLNP